MDREDEFWQLAARKGLPWFRFLRRSIDPSALDLRFAGGRLEAAWATLRSKMQKGDQVWPFEFHTRPYLGMRRGYIVLRAGRPIGGVVTVSS